ncbi:chemotaxis protein CheB [Roseospira marina]|uniref:protein-glutamate methylesterase n=1 Tax=Roseospira marina TaxID=140057 RepID=A0A5M6IHU3_9PROT|nr:CheB methylesterase domain-containing protein [Roseospira marina]KAA5607379.1 chemotaxis protein CheB [Roseospira marina]MBB4312451.1 two-component system chemotaxis response regulator CheB [Roseospira marina]MBB5085533.1 two-component system chemotaxis response regulator CheB [Roseospira marina]
MPSPLTSTRPAPGQKCGLVAWSASGAADTAAARVVPLNAARPAPASGAASRLAAREAGPGLVLIGISTGGPRILQEIIPVLPVNFPLPVVIAQHMPAHVTGSFAARLDANSAVAVVEVLSPQVLRPGCVYVGAGGRDVVIERRSGQLVAAPRTEDASPWHPSVDRLVSSAMEVLAPTRLIGVQMTGMGRDGVAAMTALKQRGGYTIAQSEASCSVASMPRELVRAGGASVVLDGLDIAAHLTARVAPRVAQSGMRQVA